LRRAATDEGRFRVEEFMGDGPYPESRQEKEEAERLAAEFLAAGYGDPHGPQAMALTKYVTGMFFPDQIAQAETDGSWERLLAFAAIQRAIDDGIRKLTLASFALPKSDDEALAGRPEVAARLFDDGLVRLSQEHAGAAAEVGENVVVVDDDLVLYPHRLLAGERELIGLLFELAASSPELEVWIAVDPYKSTSLAEVPHWLMEDYWHGPRLTAAVLDSLDAHDLGATFHAAGARNPLQELFHPLLGTWFDWRARADRDVDDPVRRLYVREVKPAVDRHGDRFNAVLNRELHAERDTKQRRFTHVDGKLARYPVETYGPATGGPDAPLGHFERARKLWRVDGPMSNELWLELVTLFFRDNELVEEHLTEALRAAARAD